MPTPRNGRADRPPARAPTLAAAALCAVALALFARRVAHGLPFLPFGDEQGHLLGALAIHRGARLYRGFVDAHGPAIFAAVHGWGQLSGFDDLRSSRRLSPLAASVAAAALLLAPGRAGRADRGTIVAAATWLGLVGTIWIVQGLYLVSYLPLGGALLVVQAALHAEPAAIRAAPVGRLRAGLAGLAGALACWTAYSFVPAVLLLALAGLPAGRRATAGFLAGFAAGAACGIAWIARFADPLGLLAFHVVANQLDYARYVHFTVANFVSSLRPSAAPIRIVQTLAICALAGAVALARPRRPLAAAAIAGAILTLDARGLVTFQDAPFLMLAFAAWSLGLGGLARRRGRTATLAALLGLASIGLAETAARHAIASPSGLDRAALVRAAPAPLGRSDDPVSARVRALTAPGDAVLALPYDPGFFLAAGRMPIRAYHDYLPWEADYARHPWFGRERDLCADLPRLLPAVIRYERWRVWGLYDPDSYMACVPALLARAYRRDPVIPDLWVRRDLPKR